MLTIIEYRTVQFAQKQTDKNKTKQKKTNLTVLFYFCFVCLYVCMFVCLFLMGDDFVLFCRDFVFIFKYSKIRTHFLTVFLPQKQLFFVFVFVLMGALSKDFLTRVKPMSEDFCEKVCILVLWKAYSLISNWGRSQNFKIWFFCIFS